MIETAKLFLPDGTHVGYMSLPRGYRGVNIPNALPRKAEVDDSMIDPWAIPEFRDILLTEVDGGWILENPSLLDELKRSSAYTGLLDFS